MFSLDCYPQHHLPLFLIDHFLLFGGGTRDIASLKNICVGGLPVLFLRAKGSIVISDGLF